VMTPRSSALEGNLLSLQGANLRLNYEINTVTETAPRFARLPTGLWLSYRPPGSFFESTGGSVLARAEGLLSNPLIDGIDFPFDSAYESGIIGELLFHRLVGFKQGLHHVFGTVVR